MPPGRGATPYLVLWWSHWQRLCYPEVDGALHGAILRRYLVGPVVYAVALAASFASPIAGLACYLVVIAAYLWPGPGDLPPGSEQADTAPR